MNKERYQIVKDYVIENQQKFYRLAFSYVKNEEEALDIVQSSICKLLECYEDIQNMKYLSTYFYRMIVNESLRILKKQSREIVCGGENIPEEAYTPEYQIEKGQELGQAMNMLTEEIRTVILLRFYEELSLNEIAQITQANLSTVKTRLYTGLKKLKQIINSNYEER